MANSNINSLLQRDRAVIMGVINTTPDSFSDGGQFNSQQSAVKHGVSLVEQGADILDVGGESTRPGAAKVSLQQELDRVIPVIEGLVNASDCPISIDTYKSQVMSAAVSAGASMINDINGLQGEGALLAAADANVPVCLMHMQHKPANMQQAPEYEDVVSEVITFLKQRILHCEAVGINKQNIVLDPGIGFGKTLQHNLSLLNAVPLMREELGCELLIGVSRKSLIDKILKRPVDLRLPASLGLAVQAILNGAKIVRVHDVQETYDAIRVVEAVSTAK